tara:strand:- start:23 stop:268 length:246 start_codon:yes stop_codon:yes gene_type:complete
MSNLSNMKMFCTLCDLLTLSVEDQASKSEVGVCRSCELGFFQPRREDWKAGWRPDKEEIKIKKAEVEKSIYSILTQLNNYI